MINTRTGKRLNMRMFKMDLKIIKVGKESKKILIFFLECVWAYMTTEHTFNAQKHAQNRSK